MIHKRRWYEPSILWAAIIGRPSSGKTPAIDAIMDPLKPIEKDKIELFDAALKTYQTEKESCKKGDPQPEKPVCKRTVIGDTTTEALCLRLKENPQGLLLYRDELAGWWVIQSIQKRRLWAPQNNARATVMPLVMAAVLVEVDRPGQTGGVFEFLCFSSHHFSFLYTVV